MLLALFLTAAGSVLDRAFQASAERSAAAELELQLLTLVGLAEPDGGVLQLPDVLPDGRWQQPGSGLYGIALDAGGGLAWRSPSLAGSALTALAAPAPAPGAIVQDRLRNASLGLLFRARIAVEYAAASGSPGRRYLFVVAISEARTRAEVASFRDTLWAGLGAVALLMALALALLVGIVARPLGRMARAVDAVERGDSDSVGDGWPSELAGVAANVDRFIAHERAQRKAYLEMLENVAHTLKTPLSVLRNALAAQPADVVTAQSQVQRMDAVLQERLSRIVVRPLREARLPVRPVLDDIAHALARIYPRHRFDVDCADDVVFPGDEVHLHELVGNLADNAAKYGRSRVRLRAARLGNGMQLVVEDDGGGFPEVAREALLQRGVRADQHRDGQGLGLAMVAEIVGAYGGALELLSRPPGDAAPLGGACVSVTLP